MELQEAIKWLKENVCYKIDVCNDGFCKDECAIGMAISALEKQIQQKPLIKYENMGFGISPNETFKIKCCPCCKEDIGEEATYCQNCGQHLDWTGG